MFRRFFARFAKKPRPLFNDVHIACAFDDTSFIEAMERSKLAAELLNRRLDAIKGIEG